MSPQIRVYGEDGNRSNNQRGEKIMGKSLVAGAIALAACLLFAALGLGAVGAAVLLPSAYVDIDVNPSIELGVNRFDRVVSARALNDDGEAVLQDVDVVWSTYEDAVDGIGDELTNQGYLNADSFVSVTISCGDMEQYQLIESTSRRCLEGEAGQVSCDYASEEERHEAHESGLGVGKWRVWRDLVDSGSSLTAEDAAEMSVRELRDLLGESGEKGEASSSGRHGDGHHHGKGVDD